MKLIRKLFVISLILITVIFTIPELSLSGDMKLSSAGKITTHLPESVSTPEKDVPGGTIMVKSDKGGKKLIWAAVIIAVIAAGVVVAGGGGGESSGNNGGGTGSININW